MIRKVASSATSKGMLVLADTKLPNFRKLSLDDISDSLPLIDYITPNEDEGRYFTGEEDPEKMADVLLAKGVRNVIIKLGGRGCLFRNSEETIRLPAFDADVIDATGAGDNFLAGFASEIIRGSSIRDALTFAGACGAVCCTQIGAVEAIRSREQVMKYLQMRQAGRY